MRQNNTYCRIKQTRIYILYLGVMAARGLLENPALFAGYKHTPWKCVQASV
jgi:hypothetical protein